VSPSSSCHPSVSMCTNTYKARRCHPATAAAAAAAAVVVALPTLHAIGTDSILSALTTPWTVERSKRFVTAPNMDSCSRNSAAWLTRSRNTRFCCWARL
jgi:hypothetical protein